MEVVWWFATGADDMSRERYYKSDEELKTMKKPM
jgi:hypothetical protein